MRISYEIKFVPIVLDAVSGRASIVLFLVNISFEKQGARLACETRHPLIREQAKTKQGPALCLAGFVKQVQSGKLTILSASFTRRGRAGQL